MANSSSQSKVVLPAKREAALKFGFPQNFFNAGKCGSGVVCGAHGLALLPLSSELVENLRFYMYIYFRVS